MDERLQHPRRHGTGWLKWQAALVAAVFTITALAPASGAAVLYVPLANAPRDSALAWALEHGAALAGTGPAGSVMLLNAQTGFGWRALREGALAIRIPESLCKGAGKADG